MELNFYGKLTHNFIHNRPLAGIIFITALVLGVGSYMLTPKQYNPQVTLPAFSVQIAYPGATAKEVEQLITKELEEKISDIPGVDTISSYSFDGGMALVHVAFTVGESLESARVALQSKIMENLDLRAGNIGQPIVKTISPDDVPILEIGFFSPSLSQNELRSEMISLINHLQTVEGVANLSVHGGEQKALHIVLQPEKLKAFRVSAGEVFSVLQASNVQMLTGTVKNKETLEEIFLSSPLTAEKISVLSVASGVRIADVADVFEGYSEKNSFVQVQKNGKILDEVMLSIAKREGENGIVVAKRVLESLTAEEKNLHEKDIFYEVYRNEGETAEEAIFHLGRDLMISIGIVFVLLLLFLGKRESLVVAIAIPLTLGLVFLVGYLFGQTINRITLFALILALGLLVDDAIVVVENVHRHLKMGEPKKIAIVNAVNEVGVGLFLCTFSAILVFLPLTQITGMMGPYMGPLSFFVPWALAMSLLVAYILTPFLADILLSDHQHSEKNSGEKMEEKLSVFEKIANGYAKILDTLLSRPKLQKSVLMITLGLLFISFVIPFVQLVHFKMLPKANKDQIYVYVDLPEGTDFPKTHQTAVSIAETLEKNPEIKSIEIFTATPPVLDFNGLFKGANMRKGSHQSTLRVNLTHYSERKNSSEDLSIAFRQQILAQELQASIKVLEDPPGPPVLATLLAKIKTENSEKRELMTNDIQKKFSETDEVVDIDTSEENLFPRTIYSINYDELREKNISVENVAKTLMVGLGPQKISQYYDQNSQEISFLEISVPEEMRDEKSDLETLTIQNEKGEIIPLLSVLVPQKSVHEAFIFRDEKIPTALVTAEMGNRSVVYAALDVLWYLVQEYRPEGAKIHHWNLFGVWYEWEDGTKASIEFGGEWEMTIENFRDLGLAMMGAMFLVYLLLVAQFRSFSATGIIMLTIPMALIGILLGFVLLDVFGIYLTATALIGFVALIGLVVKNGILFLEYYDYKISEGMDMKNALVEAGRIRLQPIVLTSLTAILANLTIVQDPVWSGLAWAIVFGLSVSTILSLIIFPLVYFMVQPKR